MRASISLALLLVLGCKKDPPPPPASASATASATTTAPAKPKMPLRQPTLRKVPIPGAAEADAVCNDGSAAAFYVRRGLPAHEKSWVVYLGGEGQCDDVADCEARKKTRPAAISSEKLPPRRKVGGIFDEREKKNPDFHGYTQVFIPYCSSDLWMGDRAASQETGGFHFRGRRILQSVLKTLMRKRDTGPSLADADRVILAGGGAGGDGVVHNLDAVAAMLPKAAVVGVKDAGFGPLSPAERAKLTRRLPARHALWNAQPDASCAEAEAKPEACHDVFAVIDQHLKAPLFVRMDLLDGRIGLDRTNADDGEVSKAFAQQVRALLQKRPAAFGPADGKHVALTSDAFFEQKVGEETFASTLGRFVFGRDGAKKVIAP